MDNRDVNEADPGADWCSYRMGPGAIRRKTPSSTELAQALCANRSTERAHETGGSAETAGLANR